MKIENVEIPALIHGVSPFIGSAQFGNKAQEYKKRFLNNQHNALSTQHIVLLQQFFSNYFPCPVELSQIIACPVEYSSGISLGSLSQL